MFYKRNLFFKNKGMLASKIHALLQTCKQTDTQIDIQGYRDTQIDIQGYRDTQTDIQ